MSDIDEDMLDDLFHGCAILAYVEQAIAERGPPSSEATRKRAYRLYEDALAEKNGKAYKSLADESDSLTSRPICASVEP